LIHQAVVHPISYKVSTSKKAAKIVVALCWLSGMLIGCAPFFGLYNEGYGDKCQMRKVLTREYFICLGALFCPLPIFSVAFAYSRIHIAIKNMVSNFIFKLQFFM
jgi:hypothetical protein